MVRAQKVGFHTGPIPGKIIHWSFCISRPYLYTYAHSNELEEKGVINLNAVNVESNPDMETLLGVSRWFLDRFTFSEVLICACFLCAQKKFTFTLFTASNSYALAAPNGKELQSWTSKLDPTRLLA